MEVTNELKVRLAGPESAIQFAIMLDYFAKADTIVTFIGEMGAGKTTLIKSFCKLRGVESGLSSPTYSIVNEYKTATGEIIYHFDLYRVNDEKEVLAIGWDEYIGSGNICLIEWPGKVENLLPLNHCEVLIDVLENGRMVTIRN